MVALSLYLCVGPAVSVPNSFAEDAQKPSAAAADAGHGWAFDSRADLFSSYIFRGKRLASGLSLQPSVRPRYSVSETRGVDLLLWAHVPASDNSFSEVDTSVAFSQRYSRATFSLGHRSYLVTDAHSPLASRSEVWGALALDTMLNPVVTVYEDYSRYNLQYYDLTLSHTFEKSGEGAFNLGLFSSFGYATNGRELYRSDGLVQITSGLTTELKLGVLSMKPTVAYTSAADEHSRNSLWGGVSLQGRW